MQYIVNQEYGNKRYCKVKSLLEIFKLRIFVNNGQYAFTYRYFIDEFDMQEVQGLVSGDIYIKKI